MLWLRCGAEVLWLRLRLWLRRCGAVVRRCCGCRGADLHIAGEGEAQRRVSHERLAPDDV